ncbi:MAG TPA: dienelactone hydrolase family protein [Candidatus Binatia bacterium]
MKSFREQIIVDNNSMNLVISQPDGGGPMPAVVVIQHQYGVDKFMEQMTERFARAGYFAVTPDLYHRDGPDCKDDGPTRRGRARDVNIIKDVNATVTYLKSNKLVDSRRVAILGFCMGGRVAYLMAGASKDFRAAISWYGGSCFRPWGEGPTPFERTAEISCPIQGHFGETDQNPTLEDMAKIDAELTKHGKPHEFYVYKDTGHSFMDPHHPDKYVAQSDRESWQRSMEFLKKYLAV